jgi:peptidyl-prolyl cis-trans isomerase SurA
MRSLLFCIAAVSSGFFYASAQGQEVLFTYGRDTVFKEEFTRVFLKNNQKEEQTDSSIQAYLDLYINFKLKVKAAEDLHLDTVPSFITELKGYRDQLAKSYMTDTTITSRLVDEAYERMKEEVNASHILIMCPPGALPKDTLAAYKKIQDIRKRALAGAPFDTLAVHHSEDLSAKTNFGNLGYFSAFDMIYPFESRAYQTPVGEVSEIFRTEHGYHVLKVIGRRPYRGEVKVAHLMLRFDASNGGGEKEKEELKRKADSIYAKLLAGAEWKSTVEAYSEDQGRRGAELDIEPVQNYPGFQRGGFLP